MGGKGFKVQGEGYKSTNQPFNASTNFALIQSTGHQIAPKSLKKNALVGFRALELLWHFFFRHGSPKALLKNHFFNGYFR
jgi:hypothetical protein